MRGFPGVHPMPLDASVRDDSFKFCFQICTNVLDDLFVFFV